MKNYMILLLAAIAGLFTSCETITEVEVDPGLANYIIDYQMLQRKAGESIKIFDYKEGENSDIVFGVLVRNEKNGTISSIFTGNFRCPKICLIEGDVMRQVNSAEEVNRIIQNVNRYAEECDKNCVTINAGVLDEIVTDSTRYLGVSTMPDGLVNVTNVYDLRQIDSGRRHETLDNITWSPSSPTQQHQGSTPVD